MKFFIVLLALAAVALADVEVVNQESNINEDGSYKYAYELTDGTAAHEAGVGGVSATGAAKFVTPEGVAVSFTYTADENGFQPVGEHIPVAPEVPGHIIRALEYIRAHPPKE